MEQGGALNPSLFTLRRIAYSIKEDRNDMATWNSRGLRGSTLEDMINKTNEKYRENGLEPETRHITLAYFEQKSTVDYIGAVQGIPVCFDAKECNTDTFPLANIHEHQVEFMRCFEKQDGVAFILISYTHRNEYYYLTFKKLTEFWDRAAEGGRKSFRYEELEPAFFLPEVPGILVPYLNALQLDLNCRA